MNNRDGPNRRRRRLYSGDENMPSSPAYNVKQMQREWRKKTLSITIDNAANHSLMDDPIEATALHEEGDLRALTSERSHT